MLGELYFKRYQIDLSEEYSGSSLSFKLFRKLFLDKNIPLLNKKNDRYVRNSYYGGHTDYYQHYIQNSYYYDINSLYPAAMLKLIPYKILYHLTKDEVLMLPEPVDIENIFGYMEVEVDATNVTYPMLPCKIDNKLIYPCQLACNWTGTYFSEELKAMLPLGYKFKILSYIDPSWERR